MRRLLCEERSRAVAAFSIARELVCLLLRMEPKVQRRKPTSNLSLIGQDGCMIYADAYNNIVMSLHFGNGPACHQPSRINNVADI